MAVVAQHKSISVAGDPLVGDKRWKSRMVLENKQWKGKTVVEKK
ncbi:hypothetical protein [Chitinophaga rhizophila]|nr:hypothetical protein [Chitinophaga rhizophila]